MPSTIGPWRPARLARHSAAQSTAFTAVAASIALDELISNTNSKSTRASGAQSVKYVMTPKMLPLAPSAGRAEPSAAMKRLEATLAPTPAAV